MKTKETFNLTYNGKLEEDQYHLTLEHLLGNLYSDGCSVFELTEDFIYLVEVDIKKKKKKKKVGKRKGSEIELPGKKDKIVFNPEIVVYNNNYRF